MSDGPPDNYDHIIPANPGFELITLTTDWSLADDDKVILVDIEPIIAWALDGEDYTEPNVPITPGGNFHREGGADWLIFWRLNGGSINRFPGVCFPDPQKFANLEAAVDFYRSVCGDKLSPTAKVIMR
jgi:hypothetical protein